MQITGFTRPAVNTPNSSNLLFNSLSSTTLINLLNILNFTSQYLFLKQKSGRELN